MYKFKKKNFKLNVPCIKEMQKKNLTYKLNSLNFLKCIYIVPHMILYYYRRKNFYKIQKMQLKSS